MAWLPNLGYIRSHVGSDSAEVFLRIFLERLEDENWTGVSDGNCITNDPFQFGENNEAKPYPEDAMAKYVTKLEGDWKKLLDNVEPKYKEYMATGLYKVQCVCGYLIAQCICANGLVSLASILKL